MSIMSRSLEDCQIDLKLKGKPIFGPKDGSIWCNATWDSVLCWPATRAGSFASLPCPPLKGLDPKKTVSKFCYESGRWIGKNELDSNPAGHTDYIKCMLIDVDTVQEAQFIAESARSVEVILLGISLVALLLAIILFIVFSCVRKRFCIYHHTYLHLLVVSLIIVVIKLIFYLELIMIKDTGDCQVLYILFEFFKACVIAWLILESLYLLVRSFTDCSRYHAALIVGMLTLGYVIPLLHLGFWLLSIAIKDKFEHCLGAYYLNSEYWIIILPQWIGFAISLVLIFSATVCHSIKEGKSRNEKNYWIVRSLLAWLLLAVLLVPNIMVMVSFTPTKENIALFEVYTYISSVTTTMQGTFISLLSIAVMVKYFKLPTEEQRN